MISIQFMAILSVMAMILVAPIHGHVNYCIDSPALVSNYTKQVLTTVECGLIDLAFSYHTDNLYLVNERKLFVYNNISNAKKEISIPNCKRVYGIAVDNLEAKLYLGCSAGVIMYHENTEEVETVPHERDLFEKIFMLKQSAELYAVNWKGRVYKIRNMLSEWVKTDIEICHNLIYTFAVDIKGNFVFTIKENGNHITKVSCEGTTVPVTYDGEAFLNFASDSKGRLYGTIDNRLNRFDPYDCVPQLITSLDFIPLGICFDAEDNIILATSDKRIIILKYNDACFTLPKSIAVTNEVEKINAKLNETLTEIKSLRHELNNMSKSNSILIKINNDLNNLNNKSQEHKQKLQEKIDTIKKKITMMQEHIDKNIKNLNLLNTTINNDLNKLDNKAQDHNQKLQVKIDPMEKINTMMQEHIDKNMKNLNLLNTTINNDLNKLDNKSQEHNQKLQEKIDTMEKINTMMQEHIDKNINNLDLLNTTIKNGEIIINIDTMQVNNITL